MRKLTFLVMLLLCSAGCNSTPFAFLKSGGDKGPVQPVPQTAQLVDYLNNNSNRIQSLRYDQVSLTAGTTGFGGQSFNLDGIMMVQKPRNFRMDAKAFGTPMVEIGSNDQEFWCWLGDPNKKHKTYQYFCSYKDLESGQAQVNSKIPVHPEWVIEVLGLGKYGPPDRYTIDSTADTVRLVEKTKLSGKYVTKVIVFQRREVRPPNPMVTDFLLLDAAGKEICTAHISAVHLDSKNTNAYLPRHIEIHCPEMKARLTLKMGVPTVNPGLRTFGRQNPNPGMELPPTAFVREPMQGHPSVDLGSRGSAVGIQQVQSR